MPHIGDLTLPLFQEVLLTGGYLFQDNQLVSWSHGQNFLECVSGIKYSTWVALLMIKMLVRRAVQSILSILRQIHISKASILLLPSAFNAHFSTPNRKTDKMLTIDVEELRGWYASLTQPYPSPLCLESFRFFIINSHQRRIEFR